jgi:hypothetical protein
MDEFYAKDKGELVKCNQCTKSLNWVLTSFVV